jgi:hypothetical protein
MDRHVVMISREDRTHGGGKEMNAKRSLTLMLFLVLLVAACGGTPETVVQTVEVEKTVVEEVTVVETVEVEVVEEVTVVETVEV